MTVQTQRVNPIAPTIAAMLMIRPIGLRHSLGFAGVAVGVGSEFGGAAGAEALGGVAEVSIRVSGFETDKPYGHGPEDHHAKVNETHRTQVRVELEANQNLASDDGENETKDDAHHPCRKIRSENIKRWRMSCHFWWDAEAAAGLARSPTLSAKAAALV